MKEHFDAQINAFPDRRTPMMLFYMVDEIIDRIAYEGVGEVNLPADLEFVEMNGAIPVFKRTK